MKVYFSSLFVVLAMVFANAQQTTIQDSINNLNSIKLRSNSLFGSKFEAQNSTGSSYFLSAKDLAKFQYTDVNRALLTVPGVNITEEDGFGLRPNISLRGTQAERSAKITLMEDGVLIAPAPYSAPAAYYFPNVARMEAIEVLKGSSQVQYGPFTTGGAINFVSTNIPNELKGYAKMNFGNYNSRQTQLRVGDSGEQLGYVVEYLNFNSDGFKSLDGGGNTGFDRNDYSAKVRYSTKADADVYQSLTLKLQYSEGLDNETYLGLTETDFENDPYRRYLGSAEDFIKTEHDQIQLTHLIQPAKNLFITTTAYSNNFARNWYKLDYVNTGNGNVGIASILRDPATNQNEFLALSSGADTADDVLGVKANNRSYYGRGIQSKANLFFGSKTRSELEVGLRYHKDQEDRYQHVDLYAVENNRLALTSPGSPGTDANRISEASAIAAHALYKFTTGKLTITPGLRYENIKLTRDNYGSADPQRTGSELSSRENNIDIFIPGVGAFYKFDNSISMFGGIHKGFSPPGSAPDVDAEESVNYELGTRFNLAGIRGETTVFFNDYSNLLGSDLAAAGGGGTTDQFNAGAANVAGLEFSLNYDFLEMNNSWSLPVSVNYTFTDTQFRNAFDSDVYGEVEIGDEIPYIAQNQFNILAGVSHNSFDVNLNARFVGAMRTIAGQGSIASSNKVDSNFIVDLSGRYHVNNYLSITANIINILDNEYAVSRQPAGLRPGHPFGINAGIVAQF
ncbi:Fe(3+) dicitrate transport protein [Nonlabens sp. Hel1_33_55]|uniref:TonB-dependent receptor family protein n=1 Tax=Nonlabens sp. Hel1_33_55 TaxID=1336802 RepID=UPI000875AC71|nr:TonB-dependent receptor [Nonlabens sp. Hel1_33_55]SCX91555.1 Fe(3+) dicitrate transport protein [Nonlabens sp. Hel1_33_55]